MHVRTCNVNAYIIMYMHIYVHAYVLIINVVALLLCVYIQISITFSDNKAVIGPAIAVNQLNLCSWYTYYPPYFNDASKVLRWPIISYKYVCTLIL